MSCALHSQTCAAIYSPSGWTKGWRGERGKGPRKDDNKLRGMRQYRQWRHIGMEREGLGKWHPACMLVRDIVSSHTYTTLLCALLCQALYMRERETFLRESRFCSTRDYHFPKSSHFLGVSSTSWQIDKRGFVKSSPVHQDNLCHNWKCAPCSYRC